MSRSAQFTLLIAGVLFGFFWFESVRIPWFLLVGALIFGLFFARYASLVPGLVTSGITAGLLYAAAFGALTVPREIRFGPGSFEGIIVDDPEVRERGMRLVVKTDSLADRALKVLVTLDRSTPLSYGDVVTARGDVELPQRIEEFDYPGYLKSRGIFAIVRHAEVTKTREGGYAIPKGLFSLRHAIEETINRLFREPEASLLAGLLLGIRRTMSDAFRDAMTASGTTHLVAVSGFNLTIVAEAIKRLLLGFNRRLAFGAMTLGVVLFTLLVGAPASAVRAAIMVWMVAAGRLLGRRPYLPALLTFVALAMTVPNPYLPRHDVSFQLSFLAIVGLSVVTPILAKKFSRIPLFVREPLATTLGAQAATLPLIVSVFGTASLVAPLANVLVLSAIPLAMFLGGVAAAFGVIAPGLGAILALPAQLILDYIASVILFFGTLPFALRELSVSTLLLAAGAAIFVGIFLRMLRRHRG